LFDERCVAGSNGVWEETGDGGTTTTTEGEGSTTTTTSTTTETTTTTPDKPFDWWIEWGR